MDVSKALLVTLLVFVGTEVFKQQWPKVWVRFQLLIVFPIGEGAVFLVSYTVWAHENVIGGKSLDNLDTVSKIVAGLLVSAAAVGLNKALGAVMNIGQNQPLSTPAYTQPPASAGTSGTVPPHPDTIPVPPAPAAAPAPEVPAPITPTP